VTLTTHPHLAPRLKKEQSYTSTPPLGFCGLLQGELYLYLNWLTSNIVLWGYGWSQTKEGLKSGKRNILKHKFEDPLYDCLYKINFA
jgi:hypothetical protein